MVALRLLGLTAVAARPFGPGSELRSFAGKKTTSIALPNLESQATCNATRTNYSVPEGGNVVVKLELDYPPALGAEGLCCSTAPQGNWYTLVDLGPSKNPLHKGENTYVCTVYVQAHPAVPVTWKPANQSVVGGFSPVRPSTPDPKCTQKKTFLDCLSAGHPIPCAWSEGRCLYEPPIDCGRLNPLAGEKGPFCIGVYLDGEPFPSGPPGRSLNPFNWTAGTISGSSAVAMPPQVLKVGQNGWFSMEAYPAGWKVCVYYNEILPSGKSSDPDTGIEACVSFDGAAMDLASGSSNNLAIVSHYSRSAGWTANGFDGKKAGLIWGQYIFWSNTTNTTTSAPH